MDKEKGLSVCENRYLLAIPVDTQQLFVLTR